MTFCEEECSWELEDQFSHTDVLLRCRDCDKFVIGRIEVIGENAEEVWD